MSLVCRRKDVFKECPDYVTAGPNSCHFDTKHTQMWQAYCLNVTAHTRNGPITSPTKCFDVVEIGDALHTHQSIIKSFLWGFKRQIFCVCFWSLFSKADMCCSQGRNFHGGQGGHAPPLFKITFVSPTVSNLFVMILSDFHEHQLLLHD